MQANNSFFSGILAPKTFLGQFIRYFITGGIAFVVDFSVFALCLSVFEFHYLIANAISLILGLIVNYIISIRFVFVACKRNIKNKPLEFSYFAFIGILGVCLNQLFLYLLVDLARFSPIFSKIMASALVLMWNFLARKLLLFKNLKEKE